MSGIFGPQKLFLFLFLFIYSGPAGRPPASIIGNIFKAISITISIHLLLAGPGRRRRAEFVGRKSYFYFYIYSAILGRSGRNDIGFSRIYRHRHRHEISKCQETTGFIAGMNIKGENR